MSNLKVTKQPVLVNLGCGDYYHDDWINIDLVKMGPSVIQHDLSQGIPLESGVVDAVYTSHVLEHIPYQAVPFFLRESFRVLRTGGVIRTVVPNLEQIARLYLETLEAALHPESGPVQAADYEWMTIELLDQLTRNGGGGKMLEYLMQPQLINEPYVRSRIGAGVMDYAQSYAELMARPPSMLDRFKQVLQSDRQRLWSYLQRNIIDQGIIRLLFGKKTASALAVGRYRQSGTHHQWMYDRFSLRQIMSTAGFSNFQVMTATTSNIPAWTQYELDITSDGAVYKPDSIFVEAIKG